MLFVRSRFEGPPGMTRSDYGRRVAVVPCDPSVAWMRFMWSRPNPGLSGEYLEFGHNECAEDILDYFKDRYRSRLLFLDEKRTFAAPLQGAGRPYRGVEETRNAIERATLGHGLLRHCLSIETYLIRMLDSRNEPYRE